MPSAVPDATAGTEPARRPLVRAAIAAVRAAGAVLRQPRLRRVHGAWALAITADNLVIVVVTVFAFDADGIAGVGVVSAARSLPAAAAGPFVGKLLDRFAEHQVLAASLLARTTCTGLLAVRAATGHGGVLLYLLAAADATAFTAYWPTQSVLLPQLATTAEELTASNASCGLAEQLGALVGPALAGVILTTAGPEAAFVAAAALFAAAAPLASRAGARDRPPRDARRTASARAPHGARAALRTPGAVVLLAVYLGQVLVLGAMPVIGVVLATAVDGGSAAAAGWFTSGVGAGGLVGSMVAFAFVGRRRLAAPVSYGLAASAVAVALLAAGGGTVVGIALVAAVGAAGALLDVATLTLLQRTVRARDLAGLMGVLEGSWCAASGLGAVLAATLAAAVGARGACALLGCVTGALAITTVARLRRLDAASRVPEQQLRALHEVPMFHGQPPLAQERLALDLEEAAFAPGARVVTEGDPGDTFFMIVAGTAEVRFHETGQVRTLHPGDWFGEIALIYDVPRTATVSAVSDLSVFTLDRDAFLSAMAARDARPHAVTQGSAVRSSAVDP